MKQRLGGLLLASLLAASCAVPPLQTLKATSTLSLSLAGLFPADRQIQVLPAGTQAKVTVTGPGLAEPLVLTAPITGSSVAANLSGIPVGPNRVIEVESLDSAGSPIPGGRFRTTATLQEGANTAAISAATTPRGDVFAKLLAEGSALAETLDANRLQETIEAIQRAQGVAHFGLIDGGAIAEALKANGGNLDALAPGETQFVQKATSLTLTISGLPENLPAEVWVDDPVSPKQTGIHNGSLTLSPVKPGKWRLYGRAGTLSVGPLEVDLSSSAKKTLRFPELTTQEAPLSEARAGAASGVLILDGKPQLVLAGGLTWDGKSSQPVTSVRAFDGTTWTDLPPLPEAVSHGASAVDLPGNRLAVIGGMTSPSTRSVAVQVYDPAGQKWSSLPDLPYSNAAGAAGFIAGTLFVTSGTGGSFALWTEDWLYSLPNGAETWDYDADNGPTMSTPRYGSASAVVNGKLYLISGADRNDIAMHHVDVYDPQRNSFRNLAPIPTARLGASAVAHNGKIYVIGGNSDLGRPLGTIESYDIATNTWTVHAPLRTPRANAAVGVLNGRVYVMGGNDGLIKYFDAIPMTTVESFGL